MTRHGPGLHQRKEIARIQLEQLGQKLEPLRQQMDEGVRTNDAKVLTQKIKQAIMSRLPEHSIVINATGMGKDTPGSPITNAGLFPKHGIAWEFNYRGELDFMHQALAQVETRDIKVEDGWLYFVHGWTQVVAQVLHIDLTPEVFGRLEKAAATVRS